MANYNKNILIGTGGRDGINFRSHYLGAVYGMERIMGARREPGACCAERYASDHFLRELPIVYVLTVVGRREDGSLAVRGLFIGDDVECFSSSGRVEFEGEFRVGG